MTTNTRENGVVTCATCGEDVGPDDNFCGACGASHVPASGQLFDVPVDDQPTSTDVDDDTPTESAATTVIATTADVDLVTCESCGSLNAAQRSRCAQCGTLLGESGAEDEDWPLREPEPAAPLPADVAVASPRRRRGIPTWAWVVIAGVVVGVGIGVATALGLGPLAGPSGPGVDFRASAYPDPPDALAPSLVGGSDVLESVDGRSFGGPNLLDGDLATAWMPVGTDGAVVTFRFDAPVWITALEIANGDQFDDATFDSTGRVRLATIDMGRGQVIEATLIDGTGRQVVRVPTPALATEVEVVVDEVTGGDDVAMAEVVVIGHPANDTDADAYRENG